MENSPIRINKFFKMAGFKNCRFIITKTKLLVEKQDYESGALQQKLKYTVATEANSPCLQSFANENEESLLCLPNILPFRAECSAGLPNL